MYHPHANVFSFAAVEQANAGIKQDYVSSITINGKQYNGSTGFQSSSGGTGPNGYYDYTGNAVPTIKACHQISISYTAKTRRPSVLF